MTTPAAIKGTFADFALVKTRKLARIVIEIPIEEADAALAALGGVPRPDAERWVAVARLDPAAVVKNDAPAPKDRRAFHELPMAVQAGIKCDDIAFRNWLHTKYGRGLCHDMLTDELVRSICGVASRANILPGTPAGNRWLDLLREFEGMR